MARRVANALQGAFYVLDEERDTGRVVLFEPDGERQMLDFSVLRGPDLESDLRGRDFTLNAIALDVHSPQALIDPLRGAADLQAKQLRACAPSSFQDDPIRILRGVRLAAAFSFRLLPETIQLMRRAVPGLQRTSPERLRDELFKLLGGPLPATSIRTLDLFGVLPYVLPELETLKGVTQSPPHVYDVWDHTLKVVQKLEYLFNVLSLQPEPDSSSNLASGLVSMRLGRFREQFREHFNACLTPDRTLRSLLFLAALYHDIAKPLTRTVEESGRIRFLEHEGAGAKIVSARARALRLSNEECERLKIVVAQHLRPLHLLQTGEPPTRRAIYRFYRSTGPAGVDVCTLSLADGLGTYEAALPPELWGQHLEVVRNLFEAWWEDPTKTVSPPLLVTGHDLISALHLEPGPQIGWLLEAIREAQASGNIHTPEEALALAGSLIQD